jgi:Peptidase A4 family
MDVVRYTVPPGTSSTVEVDMEPGAVCWVSPIGDDGPDHRLRAFADDDGVVRFAFRPGVPAEEPVVLAIDGAPGQRHVALRSAWEPNDAYPAPRRSVQAIDRGDSRIRAGVNPDDAVRMTRSEAFGRGLPLPPDRVAAPDSFRRWLRMVSTPMLVIEPRMVGIDEITHRRAPADVADRLAHAGPEILGISTSTQTTSNWSGYELLRHKIIQLESFPHEHMSPPFDWVAGTWFVPPVTAQNFTGVNLSACWVGLDGDVSPDLVQAGTEHDAFKFSISGVVDNEFSTYYAWTEILPAPMQAISNFVVSPGDEIYTEVSIGDAGTVPSLGGQFGRFLISNLTKSVTTNVLTPLGSTVVPGGEAVWIVERPTVNGTLPPLANYGAIIMLNPQARQTDGQQVSYLGNNIVDTMEDDGGTVLSTSASTSDNVLLFMWKATR